MSCLACAEFHLFLTPRHPNQQSFSSTHNLRSKWKKYQADLVNTNHFQPSQLGEVATLVLDLLRDPRGSAFQVCFL